MAGMNEVLGGRSSSRASEPVWEARQDHTTAIPRWFNTTVSM